MNKAVNLLQQYISDGQLEKALMECKKIVKLNPKDIYLMKLLSHIYFLKDDYPAAINETFNILKISPDDFDSFNNLGNYYLKQEEYEKALDNITKAKEINSTHPAPYQNCCEVFMKKRDFINAAHELDTCISLHEKYSDDYKNYKSTLLVRIEIFIALKEQENAIKFIKKYLSLKFDGELLLHLIQIKKKEAGPELIELCKEKTHTKSFKSSLEKYQELVPLYFALANFYEKEDPILSEKYYEQGNKEVFNIQRLTMMKFQRSVLQVIENYKSIENESESDQNKGMNNIFIVGMPRSGTTLTESLITANNEVFGAGELMSLYDLSFRYILKGEFSLSNMSDVGDKYIERTNYFLKNYSKVADKLPNNYHFIGHIRKFMPASKIILILRDPWDLAVSLFKQRYVDNISFASSMFNIGVQLANFEMCILFWIQEKVIDENVLTVNYEKLVENFEEHQKKLYEFCNINAQYEPKKRESFFAKTATIYQVQNKIHTNSVKKEAFLSIKSEFTDAFYSQREFWKSKNIVAYKDDFFGYSI